MYQNGLTGTIPSELGNCASLELLDLELNNFVGTVPSSIGRLTKLNNLLLGGNDGLIDPLPESVCGLSSLARYRVPCNITCPCCTELCGSRDELSA